ncbi:MAG: hypothetical protein GY796_28040, partial [Chloroflexi bacterium]|nr:hypothetical protein [Chloroflexota bacterium]
MNKIDPYQTLTVLRTEHRNLLQQKRQDDSSEAYLSAVKTFLQRGMATGCYLEMEDERWDAQSLLDYWANELYHAEQEDLNATLEEFDPDLAPELDDTLCPYMGLDPFDAQNKNLFYGREPLISSLIDRLRNGRFLALSGPSGSGKTSIVMAGLIPQMQEGGLNESASWTYLPRLISGSDPLLNLVNLLQTPDNTPGWADETLKNLYQSDNTLLRLVNRRSGGAPVVLVVDMFEEIFTLCQDQANRSAFMNNLLHFTQDETSAHILILIMRSDLENNLVRQPEFQAAYAQAQMRVTTMNANELRQAIQQPANMVGLKFEEGLVEQLVSDVLGEPVALPLLQFSLLKLWERRNRNRVTWESYRQLGGGRDALATTADTLYDNMNPAEQNTARRILLKMVRPTQGIEVVRIRVLRKQLYESGLATGRIDHVLNHFVRQRLIRINPANTPQNDQFEIAHEALVRNWPRLIGWLEEERVNLRHRLRLAEMTGQWDALKQDDSALLRGLVLEEAQQYNDLNELETTFVAASVAASQRKEQEKEAARQRELEQTRRFARRLALLAVALAFVFVIALGFAVLAWTNAVEAKNNAATAVANEAAASDAQATAETIAVIAKFNADVAVTAQAEAEQNANLAAAAEADAETERDLAAANAIDAENARATAVANEARAAENASIAETSARLATARELAVAAVTNLINDPQLSLLLALEAFTLPVIANESPPAEATDALYRAIQASQQAFTLAGHTDRVNDTAVSPDGQSIATASSDNSVRLWNTVTGQAISAFEGHTSPVTSLAFSSDGVHLISGSEDSLIILWDVESGNRIRVLQGEDDGAVRAVAFHPDNERVGVGYEAGTARIWNTRTSSALLRQLEHVGPINDIIFINGGQQFATAGSDGTVVIQNSDTGIPVFSYEAELNDNDQPVSINAIQFSPDETLMAAAKANGLTRIWEGD